MTDSAVRAYPAETAFAGLREISVDRLVNTAFSEVLPLLANARREL